MRTVTDDQGNIISVPRSWMTPAEAEEICMGAITVDTDDTVRMARAMLTPIR